LGARALGHGAAADATMTRGSIVWVNLEDAEPAEMGKTRPAVVVSNSEQNGMLDSVVVVPLSSRPPEIWPLRLELGPSPRIRKRSYAVVPAIRQVAKRRLLESSGSASDRFMLELTRALEAYLGE
jgi:mRNA-degrading endonuclease toxin of MazEF toxin-antitoxin module